MKTSRKRAYKNQAKATYAGDAAEIVQAARCSTY